jgi:hypothetical protein
MSSTRVLALILADSWYEACENPALADSTTTPASCRRLRPERRSDCKAAPHVHTGSHRSLIVRICWS